MWLVEPDLLMLWRRNTGSTIFPYISCAGSDAHRDPAAAEGLSPGDMRVVFPELSPCLAPVTGHIGVLGGAAAVMGLADLCALLHCSESEILHHDKQYEPFYSSFVALSTHYITTVCGLSKCSFASLAPV